MFLYKEEDGFNDDPYFYNSGGLLHFVLDELTALGGAITGKEVVEGRERVGYLA